MTVPIITYPKSNQERDTYIDITKTIFFMPNNDGIVMDILCLLIPIHSRLLTSPSTFDTAIRHVPIFCYPQ